jgi:hypothetical protein
MDLPTSQAKYQFFYGTKYSGAPMHSHGPAFNVLLKGEKLWNLVPPARDMYTNIHPLEWFATSKSLSFSISLSVYLSIYLLIVCSYSLFLV